MDAITPSLSDPTPTSRRTISYYVGVFVFLVALLGGILWYVNKTNKQAGPAFDPVRQFVPKGTAPLNVGESLAVFNFPKPLPFFDERNVVQSIGFPLDISPSTTTQSEEKAVAGGQNTIIHAQPQNAFTPFLSYRILGQSREAISTAFIEYFKGMGWKAMDIHENQALTFFSDAHQIVTITLLNATSQGIIAALSMQ